MISFSTLWRIAQGAAIGPLLVRGGLVGLNFAIMLWLAATLGLAGFGTLAFLWGLALVLGTVLSFGGPLILLRRLTGGRTDLSAILPLICFYPALAASVLLWPLAALFPAIPWLAVLALAVAVNALTGLASVLRTMGSVQGSMILRDGVPQVILAVAALFSGGDVAHLLAVAALLAGGFCAIVLCGVIWRNRAQSAAAPAKMPRSEGVALWGNAVLGIGVAQVDLIIGGLLLPPEALGLYALLRRVANLIALPVTVATWVSAGPIAAAARAGDRRALQAASVTACRIAVGWGGALCLAALVGVIALPWIVPAAQGAVSQIVFAILLSGAAVQVICAAGLPVATLSGRASDAALARLIGVAGYLGGVALTGSTLGLMTQATVYTLAVSGGTVWLWWRLRRKLGVDTAATALWRGKVVAWPI